MLDFWCRKLIRVWRLIRLDAPHPRVLSEPRFRNYVTIWYLIYRWVICICWLGIILCSIGEYGSATPIGNNKVWPMYLTNWNLLLGAVQSIIGAILVSKRRSYQNIVNDFTECDSKCGKLEKIYWILYTITCTLAVGVSASYWVVVYDPTTHRIDPLNIMLHVCNSVLVLVDLCITNIPLKFRYFWWCTVLIICYLICSILYFASGGLDKQGNHYIYKSIDWKQPRVTLLASLGGITFLIIVHCLLCFITKFLDQRFKNRMKYIVELSPSFINEKKQEFQNITFISHI